MVADYVKIYKHKDDGSENVNYTFTADIYKEKFDLTSKKTD